MGAGKTPGRAPSRSAQQGLAGTPDAGGGTHPGGRVGDSTVDIGALMRTKKHMLLVPSSGIAGSGLASSRSQQASMGGFGGSGGMADHLAENPVYSPDDSLAKAASKLQSLKALQASSARPLSSLAGNATAQTPAAAPLPAPRPPQPCESPQLGREERAAAPAEEKMLSGEDSGELAALAALQKRRQSMHGGGGAHRQQRYGSYWQGDDRELENTLHEYNRAGSAAPSPRLTRAQRRKSLAVGQSLVLEPGALARAAAEEGEEDGGQAQQVPQGGRRPAAGRRKSLSAAQAVPVHVAPPLTEGAGGGAGAAAAGRWGAVADEVAALSAEICGGLDGMLEPSPEKGPRGDGRSLRDKLLESWDGRSYYERLAEMARQQGAGEEADARQGPQQGRAPAHTARQQASQQAPARTPPAQPEPAPPSQHARPALPALQLPAPGGGGGAAKALLTPNGQRRRLNELTQSLQLLKVSTRRGASLARAGSAATPLSCSVPGTAPSQRLGSLSETVPDATAAAPARQPASRPTGARSATPDADAAATAEAPPSVPATRASAQPASATAHAGARRSSRRSATPPAEAGGAEPQGVAPGAADLRAELAATYQMLNAALAEKEALAAELRAARAAADAERAARAAAEQEAERLRGEAARAAQESKGQAAAAKAAQQRGKQLAQELAEAQQAAAGAAAAAERGAELEARLGEAERALSGVLKAATAGLRVVAAGREEAKALMEARGEGTAGPHASGARLGRQQSGRLWR